MKQIFRKPLAIAAALFATLQVNAQTATRLQFPNPGQHVYLGSSVTEYNGYTIMGTEFRDRIHLFQNGAYKFEAVGPQNSGFGVAHSMTSNWVAVGAPRYNSYYGQVYMSKSVNGQPQNNFNTILTGLYTNPADEFGKAIDMYNEWLVIGAPNSTTFNEVHGGYIEVWKDVNGTWTRKQRIRPTGIPINSNFGISVAIRGDRMVVGAPGIRGIYIYKLVNDVWSLEQSYFPDLATWAPTRVDIFGTITYESNFGFDVDITDNLLIVGDPAARKAAIFTRNGSVWSITNTLVPPAIAGPYNSDQFGYSVAIQFNRAVVGAPYPAQAGIRPNEGKVYLFTDGYQYKGHLYTGNPSSLSVAGLGYSVAIDGDNVVGGAPYTKNLATGVATEGAAFRMPFWYVYQSGGWRVSEDLDNASENAAAISLHPNPANGEQVYLSTTETILSADAISTTGNFISLGVKGSTIDVSTLKAGVYSLSIKTESGVQVTKLVKE